MTSAPAPPLIVAGPSLAAVTGTSATLTWTTDEPADSTIEYGPTAAYGASVSSAVLSLGHALTITGLLPEATYHARVLSADGCGNGPAASAVFRLRKT
jgi:chitodextrinase